MGGGFIARGSNVVVLWSQRCGAGDLLSESARLLRAGGRLAALLYFCASKIMFFSTFVKCVSSACAWRLQLQGFAVVECDHHLHATGRFPLVFISLHDRTCVARLLQVQLSQIWRHLELSFVRTPTHAFVALSQPYSWAFGCLRIRNPDRGTDGPEQCDA